MADVNAEIDQLYQLPLEEFTPARNALAKRLGAAGAAIKELQKPNIAAWAINQLYWRDRSSYERLIEASQRLRAEHRKLLAGKPSDIRDQENAHRETLRAAKQKVKDILSEAQQPATFATMTAVGETLEALPVDEPAGRLTRPLKPMGFEALSGVPVRPPEPARTSSLKLVAKKTDPEAAKRAAAEAKRAEEAARREAAKEKERRVEEARRAEVALEKARAAVAKAETEVERREAALAEARKTRDRLRSDESVALSEYQRATRRARE